MNGILRIATLALALGGTGCMAYGGGFGYGGPGYGSPGYGSGPGYGRGYEPGGALRCESRDNRRQYCPADTRGGVRISRQLSSARCIQGSNWGYDGRGVWVSQGCRAEFVTGAGASRPGRPGRPGHGRPDHAGQIVRCESKNNRHRRCNAAVGRDVQLVRQLSRTRCVQRQNWGWDRGGIWVDGGCRAEFRVR